MNSKRTSKKKHYAEKFEKFGYLNFCEKILRIFTKILCKFWRRFMKFFKNFNET